MSETPRTDAHVFPHFEPCANTTMAVPAEFARTLETELLAAQKKVVELREQAQVALPYFENAAKVAYGDMNRWCDGVTDPPTRNIVIQNSKLADERLAKFRAAIENTAPLAATLRQEIENEALERAAELADRNAETVKAAAGRLSEMLEDVYRMLAKQIRALKKG